MLSSQIFSRWNGQMLSSFEGKTSRLVPGGERGVARCVHSLLTTSVREKCGESKSQQRVWQSTSSHIGQRSGFSWYRPSFWGRQRASPFPFGVSPHPLTG